MYYADRKLIFINNMLSLVQWDGAKLTFGSLYSFFLAFNFPEARFQTLISQAGQHWFTSQML